MAWTDPRHAVLLALTLTACKQEYDLVQQVDVDPAQVLPCGFTAVEGTPLRAYDCNPVFTGTDEAWTDGLGAVAIRAQPLLGHPIYQLWYTTPSQPGGGGWALGHAVSTNGVDWQPHVANPLLESTGGWDADGMEQLAVVWDDIDGHYTLAYQGYHLDPSDNSFGLGVLTAPDGVTFSSPVGPAPVLDLSVVHAGRDYCWPLSLQYEDGRYTGLLAGHEIGQQVCQIYGFNTSNVTQPFQLDTAAVLAAGPEAYDLAGMASAALIPATDDEPALMFYVGFSDWQEVAENVVAPVGYSLNVATSDDFGSTWSKLPTNPLPVAQLGNGPTHVAAQRVGSRVHLWVTADHPELGQQAVDYYIWETAAAQ